MFARYTQHLYAEWKGRSKKVEPLDGTIKNLGKYEGPAKSPTFKRNFDKSEIYFVGRATVGGRKTAFVR